MLLDLQFLLQRYCWSCFEDAVYLFLSGLFSVRLMEIRLSQACSERHLNVSCKLGSINPKIQYQKYLFYSTHKLQHYSTWKRSFSSFFGPKKGWPLLWPLFIADHRNTTGMTLFATTIGRRFPINHSMQDSVCIPFNRRHRSADNIGVLYSPQTSSCLLWRVIQILS